MIKIKNLQEIIIRLKKKNMEEGITNDILKVIFYIIKKDII